MNKLLVILGSTSTGKTDLALSLAKKFNGELISCDSRQVYTGLDIGTGKLPSGKWSMENGRWKKGNGFWILDRTKVWMYDVVDFKKQYDASKYITKAEKVLDKILKIRKLPIIIGGTGLYLKGLLYGFSNLGIPMDKKLRKSLEKLTLNELQKMLQNLSNKNWVSLNSSDHQNPRRLVRAIELVVMKPKKVKTQLRIKDFSILKIGLTAPRNILYQRIDNRVISRIKQGMVEETESLHKNGLSLKRMRQLGLEYGVLADFLQKKITKDEMSKTLQGKIHAYARRQITWFKKEKNVYWFDITKENYMSKVENLVAKWYYPSDAAQN